MGERKRKSETRKKKLVGERRGGCGKHPRVPCRKIARVRGVAWVYDNVMGWTDARVEGTKYVGQREGN